MRIATKRNSDASRGFGFLEYSSPQAAKIAVEKLMGAVLGSENHK